MKRLIGSTVTGVAVAGILVAYDDKHNHASLVKLAASPHPKGVHESVTSILMSGFIFTAIIVAVIVYVICLALARRRRQGSSRSAAAWQPARQQAGRGRR